MWFNQKLIINPSQALIKRRLQEVRAGEPYVFNKP